MSRTVRQQIRDRLIEELNEARAPEIPAATKRRWNPGERSICPAIGVFFAEEADQPVGGRHGSLTNRDLKIAVQCVAAADSPDEGDDIVEPMIAHVTARLGKTNFAGQALDTMEVGTKWESATMERFYIAATMVWSVNYQTKRNDATARQ